MRTYKLELGVWWGPYDIERRGYLIEAGSFAEALFTAVTWAKIRRAGGAKAKNITSYRVLAIR